MNETEKKEAYELRQLLAKISQVNKAFNDIQRPFYITDEKEKDVYGQEHTITYRSKYVKTLMQNAYKSQVQNRGCRLTRNQATEAIEKIANHLTNPESPYSLMLYGNPGTGKTTLLNSIYRTVVTLYETQREANITFLLTAKAQELGEIAKTNKNRYEQIKKCRILFLDDLGFYGECETVNDYGTKLKPTEEIISYRYDRNLTTYATSNLNDSEIRQKYGDRIYSRMREQFRFLPICGEDKRIKR